MSNGSDETIDPTMHHHLNEGIVVTTLIYVITFLVGVPGNILVLWVTGVKMKKTVNTIWFWNLAVADILCCLSIPFTTIELYYDEWLYGAALCRIIPAIVILNMFASIFTLVAISIDRCIQVVLPVWAQNHRSLRMAWLTCLAIWILSFIMSLPVFIYKEISTVDNITRCQYQFGHHDHTSYYDDDYDYGYEILLNLNNSSIPSSIDFGGSHFGSPTQVSNAEVAVTVTRMLFGFLIPLLIIAACYIRLVLKVQNSKFLNVGRKTTKVVYGIIVAFCVTWAPYHVVGMILLYVHDHVVIILNSLSVALAFSNSCINPILYVFMGKDFKAKISQSLRELMESAFSEEMTKVTERSRTRSSIQNSVDV
ncbi:C3a anaphylatoxin chemotactic receptor [Leptodactylus fuscus]|uniref:C3a anaphylatoxin chemotactic receptor n=1 Tax=Leptodactylus fuscus TaxID=238119 RepID=UPI003F4F29D4